MLAKHLKISRPGLWFPTIWLYIMPISWEQEFWTTPVFWVGLFFVAFPLNYFVYSLNDLGDIDADKDNFRKGNFLFGAKESKLTLLNAVKISSTLLVLFGIYFSVTSGWYIPLLFFFIFIFNYAYNLPPLRLKSRPPLELLIQVGYILTGVFSVVINQTEAIPWQTLIYLVFFCFQAHLAGEIMDIEPDKDAGKHTTAVKLGRRNAKILMILFILIEIAMLYGWFGDIVLAAGLALFGVWMILDTFVIFKEKPYSFKEMRLFAYGMNAFAFGSMIWILYSGKLMTFGG